MSTVQSNKRMFPGKLISHDLIYSIFLASALIMTVMAACFPTEPLFYGNQNTKFLHGIAQSGFGYLNEDWQAQTKNGLQLFTFLVFAVASVAPFEAFYGLQLLSFLGYGVALLACWIVFARERYEDDRAIGLLWVVAALVAFMHIGQPFAKLWQGVATQYVLDRIFEPASFGLLLLLSVATFLRGLSFLAVAAIVLAAAFHPGYVFPGLALLISFALVILTSSQQPRQWPLAILLGLAGLAAIFAYLQYSFAPTTPGLRTEAAAIIAEKRIAGHSEISEWLDLDALQKIIAVVAACWLSWGTRYGRIVLTTFLIAVIGTLVTAITRSPELALIAPWRVSTVLVPLSNIVILGVFAGWIKEKLAPGTRPNETSLRRLSLVLALPLALAVLVGATLKATKYAGQEFDPYFKHVRSERKPDQLYLTPLQRRFNEFRLATGVPQYVNRKSHPYQDVEVIEWWRRVQLVEQIYTDPANACPTIRELAEKEHVTHAVFAASDRPLSCDALDLIYDDNDVAIYAISALRTD
jgi:hypothetical protein